MGQIVSFVPRDERESNLQIEAFVEHARSSYMGVIGLSREDFDLPVWTFDMRLLGQKRAKNAHIKFTLHEEAVTRGAIPPKDDQLIKRPFLAFAKALFLHRLIKGNLQATSDLMIVIKALEYVLRSRLDDAAHPSSITKDDVIRADNLLAELAEESSYRRSVLLQSLVTIMNELRLLAKPFAWKNMRSKRRELRMEISAEAEARRQEKMPSQRAIRVLIQLAMWALDGGMHKMQPIALKEDSGSSRLQAVCDEKDGPLVLGLALNAIGLNCRISELALMPHDPESFTLSKGELGSDGLAEDEDRFALRWKPVKGGPVMVKPFSRQFAPFAEMIINKLKEFSSKPRAVARHYEQHPRILYLPPELEPLRNEGWLTAEDASEVIGIEVTSLDAWAARNGVIKTKASNGEYTYQFSSLEKALLTLLPKGFPYIVGRQKYSESMFCCFHNQSHAKRGTCKVIPSHFKQSSFEHCVSVRSTVEGHQTIFERYGFYEDDGSKIDLGTHEFRHFWQTQLKKAGVSELIAAYAAGRADVRQNEAYDLRSPSEAAELSFDIVNQSQHRAFEQSALAVAHELLELSIHKALPGKSQIVSFSKDAIVAFDKDSGIFNVQGCHLSAYGICGHNYISSGCRRFMECLECDQLLCIKGVKLFEENALKKAQELKGLLAEYQQQVLEDVDGGVEGADQWLEKARRQLAKLEGLIHDFYGNESIANGVIVQLSPDPRYRSEARMLIEKLGGLMDSQKAKSGRAIAINGAAND